jgi:hypothetical protein
MPKHVAVEVRLNNTLWCPSVARYSYVVSWKSVRLFKHGTVISLIFFPRLEENSAKICAYDLASFSRCLLDFSLCYGQTDGHIAGRKLLQRRGTAGRDIVGPSRWSGRLGYPACFGKADRSVSEMTWPWRGTCACCRKWCGSWPSLQHCQVDSDRAHTDCQTSFASVWLHISPANIRGNVQ